MSVTSDLADLAHNWLDINEIFTDEEIMDYVRDTFSPEKLYGENELSDWAESHGYIRE
jgi:hypothetical protein